MRSCCQRTKPRTWNHKKGTEYITTPFYLKITVKLKNEYGGRNYVEVMKEKQLKPVFLNCRVAVRYRALTSIVPGRERSEETTICYKISLVQLITNLNIMLYLSTCHALYISVLIPFMIMSQLIINTYVSLMYELKKIGKVLTSKFVGTGF